MPSTPSPRAHRARTPPTPMHGGAMDNYEPYSPRRSKRNTAQSNPYSSFNSDRGNLTPPTTAKTTRFVRNPTHLSSPPSSPISPVRHRIHKTPRKPRLKEGPSAAHSDSDQAFTSLAPHATASITMLPTPSKTPKKRNTAAISSTARILSFQPRDSNDVMPTPRKLKQHSRMRSSTGFELYDDEPATSQSIPIFTDANARVPEMDNAEDNPFVGPKPTPRATRRSGRNDARDEAIRVQNMVRNDEGVVYIFRGKKVFRRFEDGDRDGSPGSTDSFGSVTEQRMLKRQIGAAAQRPLTRSSVKPRLLFPTEQQTLEREMRANEVDEEAVTDIEMPNASPVKREATPRRKKGAATPPTTVRTTRFADKIPSPSAGASTDQGAPEMMAFTPDGSDSNPGKGKTQSPFDAWPRTKAGRKRAGGPPEEDSAPGKRIRSGAIHSPT